MHAKTIKWRCGSCTFPKPLIQISTGSILLFNEIVFSLRVIIKNNCFTYKFSVQTFRLGCHQAICKWRDKQLQLNISIEDTNGPKIFHWLASSAILIYVHTHTCMYTRPTFVYIFTQWPVDHYHNTHQISATHCVCEIRTTTSWMIRPINQSVVGKKSCIMQTLVSRYPRKWPSKFTYVVFSLLKSTRFIFF